MKYGITLLTVLLSAVAHGQACLEVNIRADSLNGKPIDGVMAYFPDYQEVTFTDSVGYFKYCDITNSELKVEFTHAGFISQSLMIAIDESPVTVVLDSRVNQFSELLISARYLKHSSNSISRLTDGDLLQIGAATVTEALEAIPGLRQLSTGNGISKPVIRGLYGNRIQTSMYDVSFDNQQWQDEHGFGLSDNGLASIEIIKGPATLKYGAEAMGGVVKLNEELPLPDGETRLDAVLSAFSNGLGFKGNLGFRTSRDGKFFRFRITSHSHGDYRDGNGDKIINTRFAISDAKLTLGIKKEQWLSQFDYMANVGKFGFLLEAEPFYKPGEKLDGRGFGLPHHEVYMHLFHWKNRFYLGKSSLEFILYSHLNNRQEQEGGNTISLDMSLNTYGLNSAWKRNIGKKTTLEIGNQSFFKTNRNFGARTIVPNANILNNGTYIYLEQHIGKWYFDVGARFDIKHVEALTTATLNNGKPGPGQNIKPFERNFTALNGSLGIFRKWAELLSTKFTIGSGYRSPNLAELSSNGLHEGTLRYEIGEPNLKIEQNLNTDLNIILELKQVTFSTSVFYNYFSNYIYLEPTGDEYIGFALYSFVQKDATLSGLESQCIYNPKFSRSLNVIAFYARVIGKTAQGEYLPFIPADRFGLDFKYSSKKHWSFSTGLRHTLAQNHPAMFETNTAQYTLCHFALSSDLQVFKTQLTAALVAKNILDKAYYDHLSRYKYYGILNPGRSININLKFNLYQNEK
ncbi:TonB-dependent receptor [bacterium]|nr:TonB-dependent receptor [bacterium]